MAAFPMPPVRQALPPSGADAPPLGPAARQRAGLPGAAKTDGPSDAELLARFIARRDEAAFEALVRRHGPRVRSACRQRLHDRHLAEDAFQTTFLVLVCKAHLIAKPELLANWLYGVAVRVAGKARAREARCRAREARAALPPVSDPFEEAVQQDLFAALAAEVDGLPEKYRGPLVLCYREGLTNAEAARQLGCPAGSMSYRLARGRDLLRERLRRRSRVKP